jgi:hypothetical protein
MTIVGSSAIYIPMYSRPAAEQSTKPGGSLSVPDRKELFSRLLQFVSTRSGWITSVPGAKTVTLEVLLGSGLPDELRDKGYTVEEDGEGTRLIPHAIVEAVVTEGSTKPAYRTTHAGIVAVDRFKFNLP